MNRQSHRSRKEEVRKSSSEQPTAGGIIRPSCCDDATTPSAAAGCAARCSCCCWCGFALTMIRYSSQYTVPVQKPRPPSQQERGVEHKAIFRFFTLFLGFSIFISISVFQQYFTAYGDYEIPGIPEGSQWKLFILYYICKKRILKHYF